MHASPVGVRRAPQLATLCTSRDGPSALLNLAERAVRMRAVGLSVAFDAALAAVLCDANEKGSAGANGWTIREQSPSGKAGAKVCTTARGRSRWWQQCCGGMKKSLVRTLTPSMIILCEGGKTAMKTDEGNRRRVRRTRRRAEGARDPSRCCGEDWAAQRTPREDERRARRLC